MRKWKEEEMKERILMMMKEKLERKRETAKKRKTDESRREKVGAVKQRETREI